MRAQAAGSPLANVVRPPSRTTIRVPLTGQSTMVLPVAASASPGAFLLGDRQPADLDHDLPRPVEAREAVFARNHPCSD